MYLGCAELYHPPGAKHDFAVARNSTACQPGVSALGGDGCTRRCGPGHRNRQLMSIRWTEDEAGLAFKAAGPIDLIRRRDVPVVDDTIVSYVVADFSRQARRGPALSNLLGDLRPVGHGCALESRRQVDVWRRP